MADILLENIKLVVLFGLIAGVIAMSHFGKATAKPRKAHRRSDSTAQASR